MAVLDIASTAATGDPEERLRAAVALRLLAEQVEAGAVSAARRDGWTWSQIGDALGVSKQAAHKKHARSR
jgi:hypothetical protein